MNTQSYLKGFKNYLKLERSLSDHSIDAYLTDVDKLVQYFSAINKELILNQLVLSDLRAFVTWLNEIGMQSNTQARVISGLKAFFYYLMQEDIITENPTASGISASATTMPERMSPRMFENHSRR